MMRTNAMTGYELRAYTARDRRARDRTIKAGLAHGYWLLRQPYTVTTTGITFCDGVTITTCNPQCEACEDHYCPHMAAIRIRVDAKRLVREAKELS